MINFKEAKVQAALALEQKEKEEAEAAEALRKSLEVVGT